jgi:quinol monooxygenase YgiN
MSDLVVLNFKAAPGKFEALGALFQAVLGDTRAFDGCIRVDVFADETTSIYTLVEEWESVAHQQRYLQWRIDTGIREATKDIVEGGFDNGVTVHMWGKKTDL